MFLLLPIISHFCWGGGLTLSINLASWWGTSSHDYLWISLQNFRRQSPLARVLENSSSSRTRGYHMTYCAHSIIVAFALLVFLLVLGLVFASIPMYL